MLRAVVRQSQHNFDGALDDLDRVLSEKPRDAQAWLTRAFILQVQGRYGEALESCRRLPPTVQALVRATCLARAQSLIGQSEVAIANLVRALNLAKQNAPAVRLWALTVLAEIAERSGRDDVAEDSYRKALALDVRDTYLLGAYADFLLDRRRAAEARSLLRDETRADSLLLRLTLAEIVLGAPEAESHAAALEARFEASRRRGDIRHLQAEARFALQVLGDSERALRLALENWRLQREPWDARLVLEAALSAQTPEQADPVLAWLDQTGLQDARIQSLAMRLKRGRG